MKSLTELPSEVLAFVVSGDNPSYLLLLLWKCGNGLLNRKLAAGVERVQLKDRRLASKSRYPKMLSSLLNLRYLSLDRGLWSLTSSEDDLRRELRKLHASKLEKLKLSSAEAPGLFLQLEGTGASSTYVTTIYNRGESRLLDLSSWFPRLSSLKLTNYKKVGFRVAEPSTASYQAFHAHKVHRILISDLPGLPDTLTSLTIPELMDLSNASLPFMSLLPRHLKKLKISLQILASCNYLSNASLELERKRYRRMYDDTASNANPLVNKSHPSSHHHHHHPSSSHHQPSSYSHPHHSSHPYPHPSSSSSHPHPSISSSTPIEPLPIAWRDPPSELHTIKEIIYCPTDLQCLSFLPITLTHCSIWGRSLDIPAISSTLPPLILNPFSQEEIYHPLRLFAPLLPPCITALQCETEEVASPSILPRSLTSASFAVDWDAVKENGENAWSGENGENGENGRSLGRLFSAPTNGENGENEQSSLASFASLSLRRQCLSPRTTIWPPLLSCLYLDQEMPPDGISFLPLTLKTLRMEWHHEDSFPSHQLPPGLTRLRICAYESLPFLLACKPSPTGALAAVTWPCALETLQIDLTPTSPFSASILQSLPPSLKEFSITAKITAPQRQEASFLGDSEGNNHPSEITHSIATMDGDSLTSACLGIPYALQSCSTSLGRCWRQLSPHLAKLEIGTSFPAYALPYLSRCLKRLSITILVIYRQELALGSLALGSNLVDSQLGSQPDSLQESQEFNLPPQLDEDSLFAPIFAALPPSLTSLGLHNFQVFERTAAAAESQTHFWCPQSLVFSPSLKRIALPLNVIFDAQVLSLLPSRLVELTIRLSPDRLDSFLSFVNPLWTSLNLHKAGNELCELIAPVWPPDCRWNHLGVQSLRDTRIWHHLASLCPHPATSNPSFDALSHKPPSDWPFK